jgi:hypothetical protein
MYLQCGRILRRRKVEISNSRDHTATIPAYVSSAASPCLRSLTVRLRQQVR